MQQSAVFFLVQEIQCVQWFARVCRCVFQQLYILPRHLFHSRLIEETLIVKPVESYFIRELKNVKFQIKADQQFIPGNPLHLESVKLLAPHGRVLQSKNNLEDRRLVETAFRSKRLN